MSYTYVQPSLLLLFHSYTTRTVLLSLSTTKVNQNDDPTILQNFHIGIPLLRYTFCCSVQSILNYSKLTHVQVWVDEYFLYKFIYKLQRNEIDENTI